MPFTHVEIEQRKTRTIAALFVLLVVLYAMSLWCLVVAWRWTRLFWGHSTSVLMGWTPWPSASSLITILCWSLGFGVLHWASSIHRLCERTLDAIGARGLDMEDPYHTRLAHIVDEVSIATGGRPMTPYVICTPAVNACAVSDFDGHAAIAVTEGALAWLTREQLESVVGHEAGHIASGDSLTSSTFCALFALHEEALKRLSGGFDIISGLDGRAHPTITLLAIYAVLALTQALKTVCTVVISRAKEYRADAIAVRLTRNPLSLAEALRIMSKRWRGVGTHGESLSSLFITDPGVETFSESEGLIADLFSTHPPIGRRIELLLGMAGMEAQQFDRLMASQPTRQPFQPASPSTAPETAAASAEQWLVWSGTAWVGPLGLGELAANSLLAPETWVRRADGASVCPAHYDPALLALLRQRYAQADGSPSSLECPRCHVGLAATSYEGARIDQCPACHGCYVDSANTVKIFTRQVAGIPDSVRRIGDLLLTDQGYKAAQRQLAQHRAPPAKRWSCPRCQAAVVHKFFTDAYPVEVDQCWSCGYAWLDNQELELLQYLYERRRAWHDEDNEAPPVDVPPAI